MRLQPASHPRVSPARAAAAAALALAAVLAAAPAPAAAASLFQRIFQDYRADQGISACAWTPDQLRRARGQTPPDIEQYAPSFLDALNGALEAHARGDCRKKAAPPPPPPPPPEPKRRLADPGPTPTPPPALAADPSLVGPLPLERRGGGLPWPLTLLATATGLALAAGGAYGLAHKKRRT